MRKELHNRYSGQRVFGIAPCRTSANVLLFTAIHAWPGYENGWAEDGTFHYTGKAKAGFEVFGSENAAIRDHVEDGRTLRLFEGTGGTVRYLGEFVLDDITPYHLYVGHDGDGAELQMIKFHLVRAERSASSAVPKLPVGVPYRQANEEIRIQPVVVAPVNGELAERNLTAHHRLQNDLADAARGIGLEPLSPGGLDPDFDVAAQQPPPARVVAGGLRFALYWRCSTEDNQDPVTSRSTQRGRALATMAGDGCIVVEFSDIGYSRSVSPFLRPGMAALLAALADPDRDFDAVVIGSHERAFSGNQYSLVAPLLAMNGVQLWMPEFGGRVDPATDNVEDLMAMLGILARREVIRSRHRVINAMTVQVSEQGRYEGGRVPYGLHLVDGRPHPNRRLARRGICLQHFAVDPVTGPVVEWMFSMRQEGFSLARITRALNDAAIPCPSAEDPEANPHRTGKQWTLGTVREILLNPVYTGRMVWGRTRTDRELADPGNPGLGHIEVRRRNTPDKWARSPLGTHQPLVGDAGFIAVQNLRAERPDAKHDYRLRGLLRCAICERAFEGHWVSQTPGYRCQHGHRSANVPGSQPAKAAYLREDRVVAKLALLHHMLTAAEPAAVITGASASAARSVPPTPEEVIDHLRASALVLRYDPRTRTLETGSEHPVRITI